MTQPRRRQRKVADTDIVRLNALGLSLATIAAELNCHPTTITKRLEELGIQPADTRRTFMEDILRGLPLAQHEWLLTKLGPNMNIKSFVKGLIQEAYLREKA